MACALWRLAIKASGSRSRSSSINRVWSIQLIKRATRRERRKKRKTENVQYFSDGATINPKFSPLVNDYKQLIINNLETTTFPSLVGKSRWYVRVIAFCSIYVVFACFACLIENYSIPVILSENAKYRGILESYQGYASLYLYVAQGLAINLADVFRARGAIHSESACSIFIWHARSCSRNNRNRKQYITTCHLS